MLLCAQVVGAYAGRSGGHTPRWDYSGEDPLNDARGWRLDRDRAHPSQLTDEPGKADLQPQTQRRPIDPVDRSAVINAVLTNGARFYVDHAHPEYSGPEVTNPADAVRWDRAGDEIALRATRLLAQIPGMPNVSLYKNNTDGKGASYGTHENYLVDRGVPFDDIVEHLTPFLVTRPIFCGAGRVGIGQHGDTPGFQISQRADFIEAHVGLETTLRRPIINTRDEPHADASRFRRLHLITGDANLLEVSGYLKMGTTSLLLWLLETGEVPLALSALRLADPVAAAQEVSHDPTLQTELDLADGRRLTALQIQREYLNQITEALETRGEIDAATRDVLERWARVLDRLGRDPQLCAREVEWVAKLRLLEGMRRRRGIGWDDDRLAALDLQWSDLRPEKGIYAKLAASGGVEFLHSDAAVHAAIDDPPSDTRAYFRGECIRRYGASVSAAGWQAVVFDTAGAALHRVPTPDPHRGTAEHVQELLDASADAATLLDALTGSGSGAA